MPYYELKLICSKQLFNVYENMEYTHKLLIANKHTKSRVATTKHSSMFKNPLKIEARGLCFYKQGKVEFWQARNLHSERENYACKEAKACIFRLSWSFLSKPNSRRLRCWSRSKAKCLTLQWITHPLLWIRNLLLLTWCSILFLLLCQRSKYEAESRNLSLWIGRLLK